MYSFKPLIYWTRCPHDGPVVRTEMGIGYCQDCVDASDYMTKVLKEGLEIEYTDGVKETYFLDEESKQAWLAKNP